MSRYFAFTLDNYSQEQELQLQTFAKQERVMHLLYGYEEAPTTGTPHLQGCFCLKRKAKPTTIKNVIGIKELHLEICKKVYEANLNYCKKSGKIWQWPEEFIRENKNEEKQTYAMAIELAKQGRFNEISAEKLLKYDNKFKKIYVENLEYENMYFTNENGDFFKDFNLFMYGPTGTGKSFRIEEIIFILNEFWKIFCKTRKREFKPLRRYNKSRNKWWDDYMGEEIVVIEELEPIWCQLAASNLKSWLDQYVFSGEIKGSNISKIRPLFWILTSNYSLRELFTNKDGKLIEQDFKPLQRRLYSIQINSIIDDINWPKLDRIALYFDTITNIRIKMYEHFKQSYNKRKIDFDEYEKTKQQKLENSKSYKYKKQLDKYCKLINIFIPGF